MALSVLTHLRGDRRRRFDRLTARVGDLLNRHHLRLRNKVNAPDRAITVGEDYQVLHICPINFKIFASSISQ